MIKKAGIYTLTILAFSLFLCTNNVSATDAEDFIQEDFNKVIMGCKDLAGIKIEAANLKGFNLSGVDFRGAELEEVNFQGADLTNVNFQNADMEEANLEGAKIDGANFKNAELEFAKWVDGRICAEGSIGGCW